MLNIIPYKEKSGNALQRKIHRRNAGNARPGTGPVAYRQQPLINTF